MENKMFEDERFAHIPKDPKFRRIPKSERKVKIDKRFRSMFVDKKFTVKYTIDKRGRPINQSSSENLRKYYELSSSEDEADIERPSDKSEIKIDKTLNKKKAQWEHDDTAAAAAAQQSDINRLKDSLPSKNSPIEETESELFARNKDDEEKIDKRIKKKLRDLTIDYARGEGELLSDSSSDEENTDDGTEEEYEIEHNWGELDKEASTTDNITRRLAACNMDWDRIRAVDLMVLFHSFLPPGGLIKSVTIYPSDFGIQRMKEEEIKGPPELVDSGKKGDTLASDNENEEGSEYHMEMMRQYQLNRLKYYYAVLECESAETANKIYTECDGIEYESTSTKLDLRFIPDDMEFEQEPREVCDKLPELSKYQPRLFTTTALQQVKVELTWDETNPERQEVTQKINSGKFEEIAEDDIQAYLASGTSDDDDNDHSDTARKDEIADSPQTDEIQTINPIDRYKLLLKSIENEEKAKREEQVELEFTWGLGVREKTEKMVKERMMSKTERLTPFEQYLEKRREKKRTRRAAHNKQRQQSDDDLLSSDDLPSDVDIDDPYFADEIKSRKFDETDTTGVNKKKKKEERKSGMGDEDECINEDAAQRERAQLELLLLDRSDQGRNKHFDIKKIQETQNLSKSKKKRLDKESKKSKKTDKSSNIEDEFQVDVADPRFAALYTSHHFNIDPADPHYRRTKGTEALVQEKLKRRVDARPEETQNNKRAKKEAGNNKMSADLATLVKSVKRNTINISKPIK